MVRFQPNPLAASFACAESVPPITRGCRPPELCSNTTVPTETIPGSSVLEHWNALAPDAAAAEILPCCGSAAWAAALAAKRPIADDATLLALSDSIWRSLPKDAWQQAFDSHPRLGERHAKAATATSLSWSSQEQALVTKAGAEPAEALREANLRYEQRFNRIFILCANGRTPPEILAALEARMHNDAETEWLEAGEQQRQITQLRLKRWLGAN